MSRPMRWQARDPLAGARMGMVLPYYDVPVSSITARADDGGETNATFLAFSSTPRKVQAGERLRVRFVIQETAGASGDAFYRLRFSVDGKLGLTNITDATYVRIASSPNGGAWDPTTSQLGIGTGTFEPGSWYNFAGDPNGGYWGPFPVPSLGYTEMEVTFSPDGPDVTVGDIVRMELAYGREDNSLVRAISLDTVDMEISPPPVTSGSGATVNVSVGSGPYVPPAGPASGAGATINVSAVGAGTQSPWTFDKFIDILNPPMDSYNDLDVVEPNWYRYRIRRFIDPSAPSIWTPFVQRQAFGIALDGGAGATVTTSSGGAGSPTKFSYPSTPGYRAPYPYRNSLVYRAPRDIASARVTVQAVGEIETGVRVTVSTGTGYEIPAGQAAGAGALIQVTAGPTVGEGPVASGGSGATMQVVADGSGTKGGESGAFATVVVATVVTRELDAEATLVSSGVAGDGGYAVADTEITGKAARRRSTFR